MTASKSLPARPSLESLRKQAKKLARDIAAGDAGAIARARAQLPDVDLPLTQRNAQLVIAREYGYAGWQDLTAEVSKRLGNGLEWAAAQARRVIHDNDVERLKQLLAEYPALLSWQGDDDDGGLLGFATGAYGDAGDPERERWFTRAACAELLIDAGAVVTPSVCEGLLESRARGLLQLFQRKGLLPRTLKFLAALGDLDAVRTALDENGNDLGGRQRSVRVRLPLRARGRRVTPAGAIHRARSRARQAHRWTHGPPRLSSSTFNRNRDLAQAQRSDCGRCSSWSRSARAVHERRPDGVRRRAAA